MFVRNRELQCNVTNKLPLRPFYTEGQYLDFEVFPNEKDAQRRLYFFRSGKYEKKVSAPALVSLNVWFRVSSVT